MSYSFIKLSLLNLLDSIIQQNLFMKLMICEISLLRNIFPFLQKDPDLVHHLNIFYLVLLYITSFLLFRTSYYIKLPRISLTI